MTITIKKIFSPIALPIIFFLSAIIIGALLLHAPFSHGTHPLSMLDALFTSTSAVCVTGLTTVATGTVFTRSSAKGKDSSLSER